MTAATPVHSLFEHVAHTLPVEVRGRVTSVSGLTVIAEGLSVPVGATCEIHCSAGEPLEAEVIGFRGDETLLMPLAGIAGVARGQRVRCVRAARRISVGPGLLGRVIDATGRCVDGGAALTAEEHYDVHRPAPPALDRPRIDRPLSVGVRSINALLTAGRGQRLGVFAGTGVGKSVLLGMMARYTSADVTVIALVGERGREVTDFLERDLGPQGRARSVVVVSTSDQSPVLRVRAALTATTVAEYFRDQGADVLLLMDSVTRVAMAQRQIGLAAGEPPTSKGYPPSAFSLLPQILERGGRTRAGSITGLYTVLVEGDDLTDPVADAVRGILDGHVWLSRKLAMRGQYPAVSVLESISRVMPDIVSVEHLAAARHMQRLIAVWEDIADLVNIGAYAAGSNAEYDTAIRARPWIEEFLTQPVELAASFEESLAALVKLSRQIKESEPAARPGAAAVARNAATTGSRAAAGGASRGTVGTGATGQPQQLRNSATAGASRRGGVEAGASRVGGT